MRKVEAAFRLNVASAEDEPVRAPLVRVISGHRERGAHGGTPVQVAAEFTLTVGADELTSNVSCSLL